MWLQHRSTASACTCGTRNRNTDPASWTVRKVMLPAPEPPPLALRTVPATLPDCKVTHCSVGAVVNSSRNLVSRTSSQRSLPYKGVNNQLPPSRQVLTMKLHIISARMKCQFTIRCVKHRRQNVVLPTSIPSIHQQPHTIINQRRQQGGGIVH